MFGLRALLKDETGASMVEYALLLAFIGVVALAGSQALGANTNTAFNSRGHADLQWR